MGIKEKIKKASKMAAMLTMRSEADPFIPRTLCTLQGQEINDMINILLDYVRILKRYQDVSEE